MSLGQAFACFLSFSLAVCMPAQTATQAGEQKFRLVVVRGEGDQHNVKKGRATSQAVVEVRDENDRPVAGVLLTFTLPNQGASGAFVGGSQMTTVATGPTGQASVTFTPNNLQGAFSLKVSGAVQGQSLAATIAQTNIAIGAAALSTGAIIAIVAVAAGAAVGAGVLAGGGNNNNRVGPAAPPVNPVTPAPPLRIGVSPGGVLISGPRP